jgi:putative hydrolase
MVLSAVELGQGMAGADRSLTATEGGQRVERGRLRRQLGVVAGVNAALGQRFRLLSGIEVDIVDDGSLDQERGCWRAGRHGIGSLKLRMPRDPMTRRMLAAVANPRVNVARHATGRLVEARGVAAAVGVRRRAVFAAVEHDVAVESTRGLSAATPG